MKSVGEVMAIGRTFKESLLKAVRSLETGKRLESEAIEPQILTKRLVSPHPERLQYVRYALSNGWTVPHVARLTSMDPWFLYQLKEVSDELAALENRSLETITADEMREAKRKGISDARLSELWKMPAREGAIQIYKKRTGDGNHSGVQAGGHLRGGVRELYAVHVFDL